MANDAEVKAELKKKLEDLKTQRASVKGHLTRVKNYIFTNIDTITPVELECRVNIFEQYWKMWMSHQQLIEKLKSDDAANEVVRSEMEDLYCEVQGLFSTKKPARESLDVTKLSACVPVTPVKSNLPQMKLPTFSGKYSDYHNFIAIFNKLVNDDDNLSVTEKYNHLRNCLAGSALQAIDALGKSAENYTNAIETLKSRYDNKYLVFQEHVAAIFDLPKISKNSAVQLRSLIDNVNSHLNAMKTIGSEAEVMHSLITHIVNSKLEIDSQNKYEESFDYQSLPKWEDLYEILNKRCQLLEVREGKNQRFNQTHNNFYNNATHINNNSNKKKFDYKVSSSYVATNSTCCSFCSDTNHKIEKCPTFNELSVLERFNQAKKLSLCINCLRSGHVLKNCKSSSCRVCSKKHHSLLHRYQTSNNANTNTNNNNTNANNAITNTVNTDQSARTTRQYSGYAACSTTNFSVPSSSHQNFATTSSAESYNNYIPDINVTQVNNSLLSRKNFEIENHTFLSTAIIQVKDKCGTYHHARALLDSGSQLNFITDRLVQLLKLKRHSINGQIIGIGRNATEIKYETSVILKSRFNSFTLDLNCWILPSITNNHPEKHINKNNISIPPNLDLADPAFFQPQKIDMLIGAEKFFELLSVGQIKLNETGPILQKTIFGWIVAGSYQSKSKTTKICAAAVHTAVDSASDATIDGNLNDLVEKFWLVENVETNYNKFSLEQQNCEKLFVDSIRQMNDNRLMVKLPFKRSIDELGESFSRVKSRFLWMERKLDKFPDIKQEYCKFLDEYLKLGHMEEISIQNLPSPHYFIPHQYVIRPDSTSTKFRVVFNASCTTSTNISLNDILSVGPTVQNDIFAILLQFRCFRFALIADVSKMYRQIWIYPEDQNFQLIIWRDNPHEQFRIFRLKTLTYGTASAPYLATRCLNYLADKYSLKFPKAANLIKNSTYVDDLIAGGDSMQEIHQIQSEISTIFKSAQLSLRKWYSNEPSILEQIPQEDQEKLIRLNDIDIIRTLGMVWDPQDDEFRFNINYEENIKSSKITKRSVLSDLARLFDPLGLVNPIVVTSKIFMQELWLLKLTWDESLPQCLHDRWVNFKQSLNNLNSIHIPRFVLSKIDIISTEIHGFSDASNRAFGGCIYVRTINAAGEITVNLLTAKSKVAPSKKTRTLPVLELLGAELLAKLWSKLQKHFPKHINKIYMWTDSTIVLGWIGAHASKWQTFVANRVSIIQELTSTAQWKHVNTKSNPADIISRGCSVSELKESIWFSGPSFLQAAEDHWPIQKTYTSVENLPEQRKSSTINPKVALACFTDSQLTEIIYRVINFSKNRRIFAYIYRFINNLKHKIYKQQLNLGILSAAELDAGFMKIIFIIQHEEFRNDIDQLRQYDTVHKTSNIKNLNPFIDNDGLLRVGGRLRNANLPYDTRCPLLLPKNNPFINSFIYFLHFRHCHAGAQALMSIIGQRFWIISARDYTRKIVRKCIRCYRYRPKLINQIMGDLPADRVNANIAFAITGVDFCGPIYTSSTIRSQRRFKTYIAVFVCFVSKGVHLEIVTDLTTQAFIGALKRFVSRRILCQKLYCDNATNFVGARRHLGELRDKFLSQSMQNEITAWCAENSITFQHIPPRSPHFGGIWEAAVKSAKSLLYPTIQHAHLTYEHLATVCCQIESILNSRPITPVSSDPNDERALTPAHFWNQAPCDTIIEPDMTNTKISYLTKWQRVSAIQQHFWKRWSSEYISTLQKRSKWQNQEVNAIVGQLVLIHEDNLPPQKWLMGRIVTVIPGRDNKIRVVDIKTKCGIIRRSIHKIALLPIET